MHELGKWLEKHQDDMKKWLEETESAVVAVSFADAGKSLSEKDSARIKLIRKGKNEDFLQTMKRIFIQTGRPELTLELLSGDEVQMGGETLKTFLENVGLKGVRVKYVIAVI